jgi:hypothetical protein
MEPIDFDLVIERCEAVLASAQAPLSTARPDGVDQLDEQARRTATLLGQDAVAVLDATRRMLRRPFVDTRGAVLRRVIEASMIATSEAAAAIRLWGAADGWETFATDCEACRDAMRSLLTNEVHDPDEMSGAT